MVRARYCGPLERKMCVYFSLSKEKPQFHLKIKKNKNFSHHVNITSISKRKRKSLKNILKMKKKQKSHFHLSKIISKKFSKEKKLSISSSKEIKNFLNLIFQKNQKKIATANQHAPCGHTSWPPFFRSLMCLISRLHTMSLS